MNANRVECCRVQTEDGLLLEGMLQRPDTPSAEIDSCPVDAFLLVHGTGSNFYAPGVLETFAEQAVDSGFTACRINTRGHDGLARIPAVGRPPVPGGAGWEQVSDCLFDLSAWLDFLVDRGIERVALVGHSMGGVKAVYSQARQPHSAVRCLIGLSPPRFCHETFQSHPLAAAFREDFRRAEEQIAAGQPDALLSARQPLPFLTTARGFVAKYGPDDEYDYLRDLPRLRVPALILIGTESCRTSPAFDGVPEQIRRLMESNPHLFVEPIEGADTPYSRCLTLPFERSLHWLRNWPPE